MTLLTRYEHLFFLFFNNKRLYVLMPLSTECFWIKDRFTSSQNWILSVTLTFSIIHMCPIKLINIEKHTVWLSTIIARDGSISAPNCISVKMNTWFGTYIHSYNYLVCCISNAYVPKKIRPTPNNSISSISIHH